ncbi:tol-pal system-associated acyl-CoA thioesterase [Pectobacterium versatile]|uniref:Biopolymer transport protein ExbB n=1 Tax=Pectobacterium versatile TaxID=2488639 RepID=A0A7V8T8E0_9GAMM|nr:MULTISPECIES: tol-pal system-associated acyl-CoA thioesterase [Pectobacterium]AVT57066.1 tonB-system energizer ExbB [Pectobacterium versatile]MBA0163563.1 tol-pal system-associated acyl-CoA thioesterase [Pectobacterium versatile]MBA0183456.1 tol-pal system-associated acyl-CoA thioesterase [Pectobacterium versatile]MBK4824321.1 Biopolymer transport protein [Pectobacterium carotovorum subsp. carotovorum]MBN3062104.1 tol-pal system-associated acyl-CoA thioesterase [Pectobacterium versatile]
MKTAVSNTTQQVLSTWQKKRGVFSAFSRSVLVILLCTAGLSGNAFAAPATTPLSTQNAAPAAQPAAASPSDPVTTDAQAPTSALTLPASAAPGTNNLMKTDLSVWGMYQHADAVVKTVMIGLLLASVITWAIFFSKSVEMSGAKRRLRREYLALEEAKTLDDALETAEAFKAGSVAQQLLVDAQNELELSARSDDNNGIKERTAFRLERRVAATGRHMGRGNGYLATVGAVAPFVGLFGTVWGIMNSFIGIAQTQTTNLAVVAPGIAEALLATAIGLVAAIPAVVIYNVFARSIAGYKAMVGDVAAQVLLLQSRDLDVAASNDNRASSAAHKLRVG